MSSHNYWCVLVWGTMYAGGCLNFDHVNGVGHIKQNEKKIFCCVIFVA
jgi:hypothetical protein